MHTRQFALICMFLIALTAKARAEDRVLSVAGQWQFFRDGPAATDAMPSLRFVDTIDLPATTDTAQKGVPSDRRSTQHLSQPYNFVGTCWYQRDIEIPAAWRNKRITLTLERTKNSSLYLNGKRLGQKAIFCVPQTYVLGELDSGTYSLALAIDNKHLPPVGADSHQYSNNTQGNWNGILGRMELRATDAAWIDDVKIAADAEKRLVTIKARVSTSPRQRAPATLTASASGKGIATPVIRKKTFDLNGDSVEIELELPLGPEAATWDEFHPELHTLTLHLQGDGFEDSQTLSFGLRDIDKSDTQFMLNGQPIFLRGKHDGCVFPLTGHPPMDVEGWKRYFTTCKSYGLNHVRFHSWTPPRAAFEAADIIGIYLQPELPFWGPFDEKVKDALMPEAKRILQEYGNHPSFVMFSMGNEHWAGADVLASCVAELKKEDPRRLYVRGTNAFSYTGQSGAGDDFLTTVAVRPQTGGPLHHVRGANAGASDQGHVQTGPAHTMTTYAEAIAGSKVPTVSHEMGQYVVFPDFAQIEKYVGVSKPFNLEAFRESVTKAGMLEQADDFARASGALAALCYREEIEACLRTPGFGGFELLDLQDFPGQGSALVGVLDAFMDSKSIVTSEQWREFCAPQVILARLPKYVWTTDQSLTAEIDLGQYGEGDLLATLQWTLRHPGGVEIARGSLPTVEARRGNLRPLGSLSIPLTKVTAPSKLVLELSLAETEIRTRYDLWVYPAEVDTAVSRDVVLARTYDADMERALAQGQRVLLVCDSQEPLARTPGGAFATDFWNFSFFHNKPATLGLLPQVNSPALAMFPTDAHSNWQWFYIARQSQPLVLDGLVPHGTRPIVQTIDTYERNHLLGLIFEAKVGSGRLLVCASDLVRLASSDPASRQLLASLLSYTAGEAFDPQLTLEPASLRTLLRTTLALKGVTATASSFDKGWQGFAPMQSIDGNDDKGWQAERTAQGDAWLQLAFANPTDLNDVEITWPSDKAGRVYLLETSIDGQTWEPLVNENNSRADPRHVLPIHAKAVRFFRVVVKAIPAGEVAGINEIRFYAGE